MYLFFQVCSQLFLQWMFFFCIEPTPSTFTFKDLSDAVASVFAMQTVIIVPLCAVSRSQRAGGTRSCLHCINGPHCPADLVSRLYSLSVCPSLMPGCRKKSPSLPLPLGSLSNQLGILPGNCVEGIILVTNWLSCL